MDNDNILIISGLKELKCCFYNHIWLFLLIDFLNIYLFTKMYFLYKVYVVFYLICAIIFIVLLANPFYPLITLYKKGFNLKKVLIFKKIALSNVFISLFFGSLINVIIFLNINNLFKFYKECPYNYSYDEIANLFSIESILNNNITISNDMLSKCIDKKCLFLYSSTTPITYSYLCNYDSSYDFENYMTQIFKGLFSKSKNLIKIIIVN